MHKNDFQELANFLAARGWHRCRCELCSEDFFSKSAEAKRCLWRSCNTEGIELPRPKHPRNLRQVNDKITKTLSQKYPAIHVAEALPIAHKSLHTTDLAIAGVQIFDPIIHGDQPSKTHFDNNSILIAQPAVRSLRAIDNIDECSSSFINICLEKHSGSYTQHLEAIDNWISVLSNLGLHADFLHLRPRYKKRDWGEGEFIAEEVFFIYDGIELGDAAWANMPTRSNNELTISDLGFGLERLAQVSNGSKYYRDLLKPAFFEPYPSQTKTIKGLDNLRTLCLLIIDELIPGHKSTDQYIKNFAESVSKSYYGEHLPYFFECADFYYNQWIELCYNQNKPAVPNHDKFICRLRLAIDERSIRSIRRTLGLPQPKATETLAEYSERMVYVEHATSLKEIRRAFDEHR